MVLTRWGGRLVRPATLLVASLVVNLAATTFLAYDGVDRVLGAVEYDEFDPSTYWFGVVFGWPAGVALVATLIAGARPAVLLSLGGVGAVLALLAVPLYGLGLLFVPSAALGLLAGLRADRSR